jgi:hypothetical protein
MQDKNYFRHIRQGIDEEPKTAFEKNYYYACRFKKFCKNLEKEAIIEQLKIMSFLVIMDNKQSYFKRRSKKHSIHKRCFVCKEKRAFYQHHIVLLKNGGYDNGINRIPICENCHKEIHNWL